MSGEPKLYVNPREVVERVKGQIKPRYAGRVLGFDLYVTPLVPENEVWVRAAHHTGEGGQDGD